MSFHHDGQIAHTHEAAAALLAAYGITSFEYTIAPSGIENTTFIIKTPSDQFALRVYRAGKKRAAITRELAFMNALRDQGLPVPAVQSTKDGSGIAQATHDATTWFAILQSHMPGEHPDAYNAVLMKDMARLQARIHMLGATFAETGPRHHSLTRLTETQFLSHVPFDTIHFPDFREFLQRAKDYNISIDPHLPYGYSHFDFDRGNILVNADHEVSGVLDFDDVLYGPFAVCLGYTLYDILERTGDEQNLQRYITDYQQERVLSANEKAWLPIAMLFRHYVLSSLRVLNGKTEPAAVQHYLALEKQLIGLEL